MKEEINETRLRHQLVEYQVLKEEITLLLKRGFNIYFSTLALSFGVINFGISREDFWSSIIILFPLAVMPSGYYLILEQMKTIRRNAAYVQVFYENETTGVFWETRLFELRKKREEDKDNPTSRIGLISYDILKGFPTIIDILGWICIILSVIKFILISISRNHWNVIYTILYTIFFLSSIIWWIIIEVIMWKRAQIFRGGGSFEQSYTDEWEKIKESYKVTNNNQ